MSKVTKTTGKPIISFCDTDRVPGGIIYKYITPELSEDDPAHEKFVSNDDLVDFILDYEMSEDKDGADQVLFHSFADVKDRYWADVLHPTLIDSYNEAMAYISTYSRQVAQPMGQEQVEKLMIHIEHVYGIQIGRRAA